MGSCSHYDITIWKKLWSLNIPPRMKVFMWWLCHAALPTKANLGKRLPNFRMECDIYGCSIESEDCLEKALKVSDKEELGHFVAIVWECWNAQNRFIFGMPDFNPSVLGVRALKLVQSYAEAQEMRVAPKASHQTKWKPPISGMLKLNFDGGKIGESGWGWGFVVRNHGGEVVLAGSHQGLGFAGALVEEVRACLWSLQTARRFGFDSLVIEGDSLSLHQKLR
ncbi:hypothetical protein Cgig2_029036 [Carnegiea gigantea]|uniref:RNase H type-1 domain-containing protein n=1 Tax=Carnegiea gigantea TaxID=171969 RepID=A0A9Q1JVE3_9CARY|nr:hypothetical protein Cgig2_029036 [Carnegiea gigantea]